MSYRKYLMTDDVPPSELYKTVKIDTDSDTISRAKAIEALVAETIYTEEELREYYEANSHRNEWVNGIYEAVEAIKQLPPAQPEPKRGKWIYKIDLITVPTGYWECSECKEGRLLYEANFCPNCGAEMREVTT